MLSADEEFVDIQVISTTDIDLNQHLFTIDELNRQSE